MERLGFERVGVLPLLGVGYKAKGAIQMNSTSLNVTRNYLVIVC